ncbi:MAG: hypothetical protein M0R48_03950 [Candidatus Omnitrophica bacterium]|jgi:hypothetical protein|nr:hypothetical protein [Candidatus Omnitrophota bacterium]
MKNLPSCLRWGFEWRSKLTLFGLPLVHIALGLNSNTGKLLIAKGIIAIGIFGIGVISITMVGMGVIALGQFSLGIIAIAQFAIGILFGLGQFATGLTAIGQFAFGKYVLAQFGYGKYVLSSTIKDIRALEYFKNIFSMKF